MDADEKRTLRETIAEALGAAYAHVEDWHIDAVLDALGLEQVGHTHPLFGEERFCLLLDECGEPGTPVYRLAASGQVTEGEGTP